MAAASSSEIEYQNILLLGYEHAKELRTQDSLYYWYQLPVIDVSDDRYFSQS